MMSWMMKTWVTPKSMQCLWPSCSFWRRCVAIEVSSQPFYDFELTICDTVNEKLHVGQRVGYKNCCQSYVSAYEKYKFFYYQRKWVGVGACPQVLLTNHTNHRILANWNPDIYLPWGSRANTFMGCSWACDSEINQVQVLAYCFFPSNVNCIFSP
jgi:hypothetical protein